MESVTPWESVRLNYTSNFHFGLPSFQIFAYWLSTISQIWINLHLDFFQDFHLFCDFGERNTFLENSCCKIYVFYVGNLGTWELGNLGDWRRRVFVWFGNFPKSKWYHLPGWNYKMCELWGLKTSRVFIHKAEWAFRHGARAIPRKPRLKCFISHIRAAFLYVGAMIRFLIVVITG